MSHTKRMYLLEPEYTTINGQRIWVKYPSLQSLRNLSKSAAYNKLTPDAKAEADTWTGSRYMQLMQEMHTGHNHGLLDETERLEAGADHQRKVQGRKRMYEQYFTTADKLDAALQNATETDGMFGKTEEYDSEDFDSVDKHLAGLVDKYKPKKKRRSAAKTKEARMIEETINSIDALDYVSPTLSNYARAQAEKLNLLGDSHDEENNY